MIEAFFDESGTHKGAPVVCVGGYLFVRESAVQLDADWRKMLKDCQVPFFHMAACEAGEFPFDRTPSEIREAMAARAIKIIGEYMTYGMVVAVQEELFDAIIPKHPLIGSVYSWLANQMFAAVRRWEIENGYEGLIWYYFEGGAPHQDEANTIMEISARAKDRWGGKSYAGHTFRKKQDTPTLQAADFLVWHYYNNYERLQAGDYSQDRYARLIDDRYWHMFWTEEALRDQANKITALMEKYPSAGD